MINGFPIYRLTWQTLGSRHRMFQWCNEAVRATPYPFGAEPYLSRAFLRYRGAGLPVETPAVRRYIDPFPRERGTIGTSRSVRPGPLETPCVRFLPACLRAHGRPRSRIELLLHLLIAEFKGDRLRVIDRLKDMVRLAEGLGESGRLKDDIADRALKSLERIGQRLRGLPRENVRIVGTNTLRRIRDGGTFLRAAEAALGFP